MIDRQKVFNNAWSGLKAQGFKKSMLPYGTEGEDTLAIQNACAYRGRNGCKCFVGHNIPDRLYRPAFEGKSVKTLTVIGMLDPDLGYPSDDDLGFLREGQVAHDSSTSPENMKKTLKDFAKFYGLQVPS